MKRIARFFVDVKKELKRVRWPKKKDMIVYSTATVASLLFFMVFFTIIDTVLGLMKVL